MMVHVEFFGIARQRAGIESVQVEASCLGDALAALDVAAPGFADACLRAGRLKTGFVANVNGRNFASEPEMRLNDGDSILILSADAGG